MIVCNTLLSVGEWVIKWLNVRNGVHVVTVLPVKLSFYFARSRERSIAVSLTTMYTMYWICTDHHFSQVNDRIATKLAHDGLQVSLHQGCAQGQGQDQRSRDTGTFVLARKSLLEDYWDAWNYSLFASSLQSTISCISIQFARWQHDCRQSLLSTIALFLYFFATRSLRSLDWSPWNFAAWSKSNWIL